MGLVGFILSIFNQLQPVPTPSADVALTILVEHFHKDLNRSQDESRLNVSPVLEAMLTFFATEATTTEAWHSGASVLWSDCNTKCSFGWFLHQLQQ